MPLQRIAVKSLHHGQESNIYTRYVVCILLSLDNLKKKMATLCSVRSLTKTNCHSFVSPRFGSASLCNNYFMSWLVHWRNREAVSFVMGDYFGTAFTYSTAIWKLLQHKTKGNSINDIKITTSFLHIAALVFTLSSHAKAKRGFCGCQATVKVGALHCTSHILSPVSTIA